MKNSSNGIFKYWLIIMLLLSAWMNSSLTQAHLRQLAFGTSVISMFGKTKNGVVHGFRPPAGDFRALILTLPTGTGG